MEIYADELFLINFLACAGALYIFGKLMPFPLRTARLLPASAVGGVFGAAAFCLDGCAASVLKAAAFILVPFIACGRLNAASVAGFAFIMYALSGGTAILASVLRSGAAAVFRNGIIYADIPSGLLAAIFAAVYPAALLSARLIRAKKRIYRLDIYFGGSPVRARALYDSGNMLKNPYDKTPVIILEDAAAPDMSGERFVYAPIKTAGDTHGVIKVFKAEKVFFVEGGRIINNVSIGLCGHKLSKNGEYNALIGSDFV